MLLCREAVDAGEASLALEAVRAAPLETPLGRAVRATIEATAAQDEDRWHEASSIAVEHGLPPGGRRRARRARGRGGRGRSPGSSASGSRPRRPGCGMRPGTDGASPSSRIASTPPSRPPPRHSDRTGPAPRRPRAPRWTGAKPSPTPVGPAASAERPSHGWAALTPTELQVVALVADGLTNPQIAERLLMGRATVKTHLDHVFTKTGLHSRTELAAEYVRRHPNPSS